MKLNAIKLSLWAAASLAGAATTQAQPLVSSFTANNDELVLGFTIGPSTGDLVIDLGTAAQVGVGGSRIVDLTTNRNTGLSATALLSQLNTLYGSMSSLQWGIVGGHFKNSQNAAVYCTVPHGAPAPAISDALGSVLSPINTVGATIDGSGTPANQQVVDPTLGYGDSWTEQLASQTGIWQRNATSPVTTTTNSFATGGLKFQLADLYMRTSGTGSPSVYQGYFTLGNNGSLTFTPGSATPPPPPPTPVLSIVRSNSVNIISFVSSNSATYKLFLTNSAGLNSQTTNWPSLPGTIVGNGSTKSFQDTTTDALRFYRVQAY